MEVFYVDDVDGVSGTMVVFTGCVELLVGRGGAAWGPGARAMAFSWVWDGNVPVFLLH